MKISPKFTDMDWKKLNLTGTDSKDWEKAIEISEDRIKGRFFNIIDKIESCTYAGSVVIV